MTREAGILTVGTVDAIRAVEGDQLVYWVEDNDLHPDDGPKTVRRECTIGALCDSHENLRRLLRRVLDLDVPVPAGDFGFVSEPVGMQLPSGLKLDCECALKDLHATL